MPRLLRIVPFFAALAAVMWVASCGGGDGGMTKPPPPPPNRAPTAVGSIAAQTITAGESATVNVSSNFNDPDGDALTFAAATSDAGVATASVAGSTVTITGVAAGSATITVTARDPDGATATQAISVTVEAANQAPVAVGSLGELTFDQGGEVTVHVAEYFSDPDGDALTYTAASSDTTVVTATTSDTTVVVVVGVGAGSATVTVTATDPGGLSATQDMAVMILPGNQAPQLTDSIPAQMIMVGDTVRLVVSAHFTDPDEDDLTYEAVSSDTGIATALASGDTVTIGGQAAGGVSVTVSASDPEGLSASQEVMVTVEMATPNRAPTLADDSIPVPAHDLVVDSAVVLDLSPYFADPDGDPLIYTAVTSDEAVAMATVDGTTVTTTAVSAMEDTVLTVTLTVTATDPEGLSSEPQEVEVFVAAVDYGPWEPLSITDEGKLQFSGGGATVPLLNCFSRAIIRLFTSGEFDVHWTEWQLKRGSGWIRAPGTRNVAPDDMLSTNVICPYKDLEDGTAEPGIYRVVGEVTITDADGNAVRTRQKSENEFTLSPEGGLGIS